MVLPQFAAAHGESEQCTARMLRLREQPAQGRRGARAREWMCVCVRACVSVFLRRGCHACSECMCGLCVCVFVCARACVWVCVLGVLPSQHSLAHDVDVNRSRGRPELHWCGMVWCDVVWCGVVWCGVVWCGVVWCGVVWCGVVWCGVVW